MFIHIGERKTISIKSCVGIFNYQTLIQSDINVWICSRLDNSSKTVALPINGDVISSKVSPFTVIKRNSLDTEFFWRRI
jgi:hypothetical protein